MPPATRTPPDFSVAFYLRQLLPKSNVFVEAMRKFNRLTRRTKGYTKSVEMLVYPLALVCWQQGEKLNIYLR